MTPSSCATGDLVVEVRSLQDSPHSIRSSYWIREVGPECYRGGPFQTLPEACREAGAMARTRGSRVWRKISGLLTESESVLQLVEPGA